MSFRHHFYYFILQFEMCRLLEDIYRNNLGYKVIAKVGQKILQSYFPLSCILSRNNFGIFLPQLRLADRKPLRNVLI